MSGPNSPVHRTLYIVSSGNGLPRTGSLSDRPMLPAPRSGTHTSHPSSWAHPHPSHAFSSSALMEKKGNLSGPPPPLPKRRCVRERGGGRERGGRKGGREGGRERERGGFQSFFCALLKIGIAILFPALEIGLAYIMHSDVHCNADLVHMLRKSDCLGCAVLLCLVVCSTLHCFFLPSHLSLKHVY